MTQIETHLAAMDHGRAHRCATSDMIEADLRATDLVGAALRGVRADRAELAMADLRHADARDMVLAGANLRAARLEGCDLRHADLRDADLSGIGHDDATQWSGALISLGTTLPDDLDLAGNGAGLLIDPS